MAEDGTTEATINLAVAKKLEAIFALFGQETIMVREEDVSIHSQGVEGLRNQKVSDIHNRVGLVNATENALLISVHQNSLPQVPSVHGAQVFYNGAEGAADLAAAVSAASGSLAGIIPPSVTIIVYGVATETPIGRMFIASMIPGILTTIVFIFCNLFFLNRENRISRQSGEEKAPFEPVPVDKKSTTISAIVAIIIAITIFGGIYSGFMTATEAGAVAATVAFICALLLGKVNKDFLVRAAKSSV